MSDTVEFDPNEYLATLEAKDREWDVRLRIDRWELNKIVEWLATDEPSPFQKDETSISIKNYATPQMYKDVLLDLAMGSIVSKVLQAQWDTRINDYWIVPIEFLMWCHAKKIALPDPLLRFLLLDCLHEEDRISKLSVAMEMLKECEKPRIPSICGASAPIKSRRHDQDQMEYFLSVVKDEWRKDPAKWNKDKLLRDNEKVKAARKKFTHSNGRPKKYSDARLKRLMSNAVPNEEARKPGRRKSC